MTSLINNRYEFTGKEIDTANEGGLTHFLFREYTTNLGRFMSPDLLAGNIGDPQSLNRYAYVLNDPLNFVDPFGLDEEDDRRAEREERFQAHLNRIDARNLAGAGGANCFMNGLPANCGMVSSFAGLGGYGTYGIFCTACSPFTQWNVTLDGHLMINLGSIPGYNEQQAYAFDRNLPQSGTVTKDANWADVGVVAFLGRTPIGGASPFAVRHYTVPYHQFRFYNWRGNAWFDIDFHRHTGNSNLPQNPHRHTWDGTDRSRPLPLIPSILQRILNRIPYMINPCLGDVSGTYLSGCGSGGGNVPTA